jgi:hypothetical protein
LVALASCRAAWSPKVVWTVGCFAMENLLREMKQGVKRVCLSGSIRSGQRKLNRL